MCYSRVMGFTCGSKVVEMIFLKVVPRPLGVLKQVM